MWFQRCNFFLTALIKTSGCECVAAAADLVLFYRSGTEGDLNDLVLFQGWGREQGTRQRCCVQGSHRRQKWQEQPAAQIT